MPATLTMSAVAPRVAFARPRTCRRPAKAARLVAVASGESSGKATKDFNATCSTDRSLRGDQKVDLNRGEKMT